jgi:hypothetical protein
LTTAAAPVILSNGAPSPVTVEAVMRNLTAPCLVLAFALGGAGLTRADDSPRALVEKAVKALGGEELLSRRVAEQTRYKGAFVGLPGAAGGVDVTGEMWSQPGSRRLTLVLALPGQGTTVTTVVHNGKGWEDDNGTLRDLDADEVKELMVLDHVERVLTLVPLLKDQEFTLEGVGKSKVDGAEVFGVKVSAAGHPEVLLSFDPATGYPKRVEYPEKSKGQVRKMAIVFDDYRELQPEAAEERALKAAKVGTDGAALLEFLRGRVPREADRENVKRWIKQLGDDSSEVREQATQELMRLGSAARGELRRAAKDDDVEVSRRAQRCLDKIAEGEGPDALPAALRLVAIKRPPGAAEVLLALAPALADDDDARELRNALAAVALPGGKPDRVVEQALEDKDPARRAAAAAVLGKDGGAFEKQPGRRLFPTGLKHPMKTTYYQDGQKQLVLEVADLQFFNRFDDKLFARAK